jgi:hypothetical protein
MRLFGSSACQPWDLRAGDVSFGLRTFV